MTAVGGDLHAWWAELRHGGLLLSPVVLAETFPDGVAPLGERAYRRLRDRYTAFEARAAAGAESAVHDWLDAVLEEFLAHPADRWRKGASVPEKCTATSATGQRLRPHRVLVDAAQRPVLLVQVDDAARIGQHRGRRAHARLVELLRLTGSPLGLLTNGRQFRLCHAGLDHDAWCEWEAETWVGEEESRGQLRGLLTLVGRGGFAEVDGGPRLHVAVEASRSRQGELSQVLGDQVRQAVEALLAAVDAAARRDPAFMEPLLVEPEGARLAERPALAALYQAATRIIMRLVVVLFAEARELLPRSHPIYDAAYGVEGLFARLEAAARHEGPRGLEGQFAAWPRLLALFRLIHEGSAHEGLPVPAYGGTLFRAGDPRHRDPVLRALALLEDERLEVSDARVLRFLRCLKIGRLRIRQGRASAWVAGPVDFSDLRTEYIGILYEGLLDYELRRVGAESPMVALGIGKEPVLPLALVEGLSDSELKDLIGKLAKEKDRGPTAGEEDEEEQEDGTTELDAPDADAGEEVPEEEAPPRDDAVTVVGRDEVAGEAEALHRRALAWASRAVEVAGLIRRPRGRRAELEGYERRRAASARGLLRRVLAPRELYLVRWGGTRKGSGTFYTRPQLAVPTAHRTLEPLVYVVGDDGTRRPREPEAILALKVCDPAMGSGSFLVAALRYLTQGLFEALLAHGRVRGDRDETVVTLPFGGPGTGRLTEELLPVPPEDDRFERLLTARLKRYVVERCLYGVDLNPLAVELGRLALWVETMDERLPFEFLDDRLKVGNALVGAWFDRFPDYPVLAWDREGGDGAKGPRTKRLKAILNSRAKPAVRRLLEARGPQLAFGFGEAGRSAEHVQATNLEAFARLEAVPPHLPDERERIFRAEIEGSAERAALKRAFDRWCAVWFWPVESEAAPLLLPDDFASPGPNQDLVVQELQERHGFFHWELEFPRVFMGEHPGFDAVLGNPPWDIQKPNSREFFSNWDPIYRTYGKQEALGHQRRLFGQDPAIEVEWVRYAADFKAMSHWVGHVAEPYDVALARGREGEALRKAWADLRAGRTKYHQGPHPYRHQGSADINTYKLFLELAHHLLRDGGRLGFIVPSGLYTDKGAEELRRLILDNTRLEWLFGFWNRKKIFPIYWRTKFGPIILSKGGHSQHFRVVFMREDLSDWETSTPSYFEMSSAVVCKLSPTTRAFFEIQNARDLEVCEKLYTNHSLLGASEGGNWKVEYIREFDMTNDSKLFPPRPEWERNGYRAEPYSRWIGSGHDLALPLYEGRMIGQFDFSEKGWVSGKGRSAVWRELRTYPKTLEPQYMMSNSVFDEHLRKAHLDVVMRDRGEQGAEEEAARISSDPLYWAGVRLRYRVKLTFMDVSAATNTRTFISTVVAGFPCGHSAPTLRVGSGSLLDTLLLCAILNSFCFDFVIRVRGGGQHLTWFQLAESPLPSHAEVPAPARVALTVAAARLALTHECYAPEWLGLGAAEPSLRRLSPSRLWAVTHHERLLLRCIIDAIVSDLYGLDYDDVAWILRECEHPSEHLRDKSFTRRLDPKGFWRVGEDQPPEVRHPALALLAVRRLRTVGLDVFCAEDWQFPSAIGERLGPRWLPWQLESDSDGSWRRYHAYARAILGEGGMVGL